MRRFSAAYLDRTRRGMWDSREALAPLELPSRERVLDVGCGTGEFTRVLAEESPATVIGVDADPDLLAIAREAGLSTVAGDATRLPVHDDAVDLAVCQALLSNLRDPAAAVREFARASSDLVAAVEPNNAAVRVESTVEAEEELEPRVREAYLAGVGTDVALGDRVSALFESAGLEVVARRRYRHEKVVDAPYSEAAVQSAARKATGEGLDRHERELRAGLEEGAYEDLRSEWRAMGRTVAAQMQTGEYRRREIVPFDVTVGRPPEGAR